MAQIVFMGTPDFAVPALQALIAQHQVIAVVTQPDRPAGRGKQVQMSPVKQTALAGGVPVFQPEKLRHPDSIAALREWRADVYVVAAFGQILPKAVLDLPPTWLAKYPCFAAAPLAGSRADPGGHSRGRCRKRRDDHAHGCRAGYRADADAARDQAGGG